MSDDIGYKTIMRIEHVRTIAAKYGLKFCAPKHAGYDTDRLALCPLDDSALPLYSRDAQLFVGTLSEVEVFLMGLQWARDYDRMLKLSTDDRRAKKEQDYRNRQLITILSKDNINEP